MPYILADDRPTFITRNKRIDRFLTATGARIVETGNKSYYDPERDVIYIAHGSTFRDELPILREHRYYCTLFHELAHWAGSSARLNLLPDADFATVVYGINEMVAEAVASLLCATYDITTLSDEHQEYLAHWHQSFNRDQVIFEETVMPLAEQTLSYLLAFEKR